MLIASLRIQHYKSFLDSAEIALGPGFNVIVGQNNAGKTALLEAASLRFSNNPHRSLKTVPTRAAVVTAQSESRVRFALGRQELFDALADLGEFANLPLPARHDPEAALDWFVSHSEDSVELECLWAPVSGFTRVRFLGMDLTPGAKIQAVRVRIDRGGKTATLADPSTIKVDPSGAIPFAVAGALHQRIYSFRAERLHIGESAITNDPHLSPDARNLAQVLHFLQSSNPPRWGRYLGYLRAVFPQITQITVPPVGSNARVLVWSIDAATERDDLAVPLAESGTGIGQVLAILYVVLTSEVPRPILIDEPQSFLHPGAVRKLFEILRLHPQHQYVITTHSAAAVTAASPTTLLMARITNGESTVERLNVSETQHLRAFLMEVGARLSDVFGADNILWVEGRTEELCFPLIMEKRTDLPISATTVLGVKNTGDFESRAAETAFDVYQRLSRGPRLMPPAVGFIFDREGRSAEERADLERRSGGRVRFTERRMYENYLLNPRAIAAIASAVPGFAPQPITAGDVEAWIGGRQWERPYFARTVPEPDRTPEYWRNEVHGAKLLADLFAHLSETRVSYDKVKHGLSLTTWICENSIDDLKEIGDTISELLANPPA